MKSPYKTGTAWAAPVTPFVGVWIEILRFLTPPVPYGVTPFVGVWIEIGLHGGAGEGVLVTPFVGVWIEIWIRQCGGHGKKSLPSWECGLK